MAPPSRMRRQQQQTTAPLPAVLLLLSALLTTSENHVVNASSCDTEKVPINCHFDELIPGVAVEDQTATLHESCGLKVTSTSKRPTQLGLFDSTNITAHHRRYDPDLGSPNRKCPGFDADGPSVGGRGVGGEPFLADGTTPNPFANCDPLGKLLIMERSWYLLEYNHKVVL